MNMISTASFLHETDASNKQAELVKTLTAAWEKKNSKAARAGGVSLMALSLAACGGEDTTPFSQADVDSAESTGFDAGVASVDITTDNQAAIDAAIAALPADTTPFAQSDIDAAVAAVDITTDNQAAIDAAVAAVDLTTDNQAAIDAAIAALPADTTPFAQSDIDAAVAAVDITTDNQAAIDAAVAAVDLTTDNAAATSLTLRNAAAELGVTGTSTMTDAELITAIKTSNDAAIESGVDVTADNAAAISAAYKAAAADLGVTGTATMTDAELVAAIQTANDAAVEAGVDVTTNDAAAINAAVAADTSFATLAELVAAYDALANPTVTSFTLSTSVDTVTGSSSDDTITADNTGTDVTSTADTINGGDGTDTLNIFSDGAAGALPALTSVETVNFYDQDDNFTLAANAQAGVTTVGILRGDGGLTATLGSSNTTVNITDVALSGTGVILTADTAATSMTIGLSGITAGGVTANEDVHLNGSAITNVTVNATGSATMDALDLDAATSVTLNAAAAFTTTGSIETTGTGGTLTITGAGAVDLSGVDAGFTTVNASALTGALTAEVGTHDALVLTAGSGNDVITASTTDALATSDDLSINAGGGTDVLVVAATADINTAADGARYTGFETIRTADTHNMALVSGIENLEITGGTSETYSNLSATQAQNITFTADNTTSTIFSMATDTSADSIKITTASTTATTDVDLVGIDVDNIETVTFNLTTGTNTTGDTALGFLANKADEVTTVNFLGTADTTFTVATSTLDVVAVTLNASGMTGTADFTLVQTGDLVKGSTVTGTSNGDTIALGTTTGSTYNGGDGNDGFSTVAATLVATGTDDTVVNGGDGTDTITITDDGSTMTDNHFTFVSNVEALTYSDGGAVSLTAGANFASAFSSGVTITAAGMDDAANFTYAGGLADVATTMAITSSAVGNGAGEDITITTGDAADTVTLTASSFVGANSADGGAIAISTAGGDDTITLTVGDLDDQTTSAAITITGGAGADTINVTKTANDNTAQSVATFVFNNGDSTTSSYDTITGFDVSDGTEFSDGLDFAGVGAVTDFTNTVDYGTIKSHSLTAGVVTFDDAAAFSSALVISSTNLDDVLGYLAANTDTLDVAAFAYDSTGNGTADATMVYSNGATDSLVLLASLTGVDALISAQAAGANDLFIA